MGGSHKMDYLPAHDREVAVRKKRKVFRPEKKLPVIIVIILLIYLIISFVMHFNRLFALQNDITEIRQQVNELKMKNEDLKKQLKQVQSDTYIEQVARERLGLIKPGETRVVPTQKPDQ
jgi:cell division protein FtsL